MDDVVETRRLSGKTRQPADGYPRTLSAMSAEPSLDDFAIPLVTVPDDTGSSVGAKFEVNPDAIKYLQSIRSKVQTRVFVAAVTRHQLCALF